MARDATETRNKLIRAGEQRFARDGVDGATLRDIVRTAGQANDAAVGYHFGSRDGLIRAIVERHMEAMESERSQTLGILGDADLVEVVEMVVLPIAELLSSPEGRDFLRIAAQLADGSLLSVLDDFAPEALPVHLVYREGRRNSVRVRSFVDYAVARLRGEAALGEAPE